MTEVSETGTAHMDDFKTARRAMVDSQLRPSDVSDPVIIGAMAVTPRENFISPERRASAYIDRAIPLTANRVLNPPLSTGLLLTRANILSSDNVLIIGAATGYIAALLASTVKAVVALEEDDALFAMLEQNIAGIGNITGVHGPLDKGFPKAAPYSLIIIDGAVETIPEPLTRQLADDGRLVCGVYENGVTRLAIGRKGQGEINLTDFTDGDIALLTMFARPAEYVF